MTRTAPELATVWITKYALTSGIVRADGCRIDHDGYVSRGMYSQSDYVSGILGRTAFLTEAEAIADAVRRGRAKLRAIDKQRRKIEGLIRGWEAEGEENKT